MTNETHAVSARPILTIGGGRPLPASSLIVAGDAGVKPDRPVFPGLHLESDTVRPHSYFSAVSDTLPTCGREIPYVPGL